MEDPIGKVYIPGLCIGKANKENVAGPGTYEHKGYILASLAGVLKVNIDEKTKVKTYSVDSLGTPSILPKPGDSVTAKVTIVNPRMVQCVILCVGNFPLARLYRGVIKKEDISNTDKDNIDPYKCYRPGDIILARVLAMTEVHWYHLSTAENELGVAIASADGCKGIGMVPTSWSEMQCPVTLVKEPRKVARILPDSINDEMIALYRKAKEEGKIN